jgi:lysophospholipase L1-like esterase
MYLALLVTVLGVVLLELGGRVALRAMSRPSLYHSDHELGYRLRAGLHVRRSIAETEATWTLSTDEHGRRVTPMPSEKGRSGTVLLLGDSMTLGEGVNDEETFAAHISRAGLRVVNLGVQGYGTNQQLLTFRRHLARPHNPIGWVVVVVSVNDGTDVRASYQSMRHRPTAFLEAGALRLAPFDLPTFDRLIDISVIFSLWRYATGRTPVVAEGDGPAIVAACLEAIKSDADAIGARTLLVAQSTLNPDAVIPYVGAAEARDLTILDLSQVLNQEIRLGNPLTIEDGIHWNAEGHRIVAERILHAIEADQK